MAVISKTPRKSPLLATTMSTAPPQVETRISSVAMDLLGCYVSEFDKIIYELAKGNSHRRMADEAAHGKAVVVDVEDVKKAAEVFTSAIKEHFGIDPKHADLVEAVEGMHECLKKRCESMTGKAENPR